LISHLLNFIQKSIKLARKSFPGLQRGDNCYRRPAAMHAIITYLYSYGSPVRQISRLIEHHLTSFDMAAQSHIAIVANVNP